MDGKIWVTFKSVALKMQIKPVCGESATLYNM